MRMPNASENQNREGGGARPSVQQLRIGVYETSATHLFVTEGGIQ